MIHKLTCTVTALEPATHDIRIVRLAPPVGTTFDFCAGQYARLSFGGLPERDYSMARAPGRLPLEFHIRDMGDGASRYVAGRLAIGEAVRLVGPFGDAWLRAEHLGPLLCVAGGSGLAPIKAIVEAALAADAGRDIRLYFGARRERDIYLERHFRDLAARHAGLRFVPVVAEGGAPGRRRGRVIEAVAADLRDPTGFKAYLAGPPAMVESAAALLRRCGLADGDIHADPFVGEAEKQAQATAFRARGKGTI